MNSLYQILVGFIFVYQKSLKRTFKNSFSVQNHLLNLCSSAENSQRLLFIQKAGVKCSYKSFLVYKVCLLPVVGLLTIGKFSNILYFGWDLSNSFDPSFGRRWNVWLLLLLLVANWLLFSLLPSGWFNLSLSDFGLLNLLILTSGWLYLFWLDCDWLFLLSNDNCSESCAFLVLLLAFFWFSSSSKLKNI